MYGNILFDNNEDKVNFNSYKGCMIMSFPIIKFAYYIIGEVPKELNIFFKLENQKDVIYHSFQRYKYQNYLSILKSVSAAI